MNLFGSSKKSSPVDSIFRSLTAPDDVKMVMPRGFKLKTKLSIRITYRDVTIKFQDQKTKKTLRIKNKERTNNKN